MFGGTRKGRRRQRQLEAAMGDLALAFVTTATRAGHPLDLTVDSAQHLDEAVSGVLAGRLSSAMVGGVVRGAAAYLGEVVVAEKKAVWTLQPGTEQAVLAMLPDGDPMLNLVSVVDRRIRPDRPESLVQFLDRCLDGFTRPPEG